ncbi:MAG: hypothetical protein RL684_2306 [Pseudomonadota bacterium]|jgi:putative adenylate-forming enzyme
MKLAALGNTVASYLRARRIDALQDPAAHAAIQSQWLARHLAWVTRHSGFYQPFVGQPLDAFPVIGKREWLEHFNDINTAGADRGTMDALSRRAEQERDFSGTWRGHAYGLSTGTSGRRALFLASERERATWAGTILAKILGGRLLRKTRIALVLRAGNTLYDSVGLLHIRFLYVDPFQARAQTQERLRAFQPTILVAPPQILAWLASNPCGLRPERIISVAEVLDVLDRQRIEATYGVPVEQIYQATEGLIGVSCEQGVVHLNEPFLYIEREWQDTTHTRFIPVVTDLWRRSQPVIRYRLDDVLQLLPSRCACGRLGTAVAAIEGRRDDLLHADGPDGPVPVFSDLLARIVVRAVEELDDFEIVEEIPGKWAVRLRPMPAFAEQQMLLDSLRDHVAALGARPPAMRVEVLAEARDPRSKQRRIRASEQVHCVR